MNGIQLAECMKSEVLFLPSSALTDQDTQPLELTVSSSLCCSFCQTSFKDQTEQRNHYKLDWHRHNLKQSLRGRAFVNEEEFAKLADDVSSISGSESESNDSDNLILEERDAPSSQQQNHAVSIRHPKDAPDTQEQLFDLAKNCPKLSKWAILMIGGGHFAAAVFEGNSILLHKTFHSYTVRAKQGGSQGSRDSRSGTSHPKSADVLETWSSELEKCNIIFLRAVSHNRSLIFTGKNSPIKKSDKRIRNIPFPTRRATFSEVKRVHGLLSTIELYGSADDFLSTFPVSPKHPVTEAISRPTTAAKISSGTPPSSPKKSPRSRTKIDRGKPRLSPCRPLPDFVESLAAASSTSEDETSSIELVEQLVVMDFADRLQEFENNVHFEEEQEDNNQTRKSRSKRQPEKKQSKENSEPESVLGPVATEWFTRLKCVCQDPELLLGTLAERETLGLSEPEAVEVLNHAVDKRRNTMLHIASTQGQPRCVRCLLEAGSDPAGRNTDKKTAFKVAKDWDTKKAFRRFQADFPDKYDYKKKKARKERLAEKKKSDAEQKKLEEEQKREQEERNRFLNLNDREKRALAAERRLLASGSKVMVVRCFLCGCDMTGQVPFAYQNFSFCSMQCLKAHRLHNSRPF
ncbi:hypothetical protein B566_EDAN006221 [Ephemera danica]|nr:hypothetical protein B566_EDAN006221 [Ephemera danica]